MTMTTSEEEIRQQLDSMPSDEVTDIEDIPDQTPEPDMD